MRPNREKSIAFVWQNIVSESQSMLEREPVLKHFLQDAVLDHSTMAQGLGHHLVAKLCHSGLPKAQLKTLVDDVLSDQQIVYSASRDIQATLDRDSACNAYSTPFLYFKGYLAVQAYRIAHALWHSGNKTTALLLQHSISTKFGVDIHPAAVIGSGVLMDHGTGIVIGETAVVDDCVSIMQSVTLGGTGKQGGDRHPKIRKGVLLGPGAKILGNIEVGAGAMVAASSVVLESVPAKAIVAGVPATVVGESQTKEPSKAMNHYFQPC
ncbi:MAG: serine O-acetyltransferase [Porticoccaceae bacterium]